MSASATALLQQAIGHHQAGRLAEAEPLYRRILEGEPRNANALYLLGVLAAQLGRSAEAAAWLEQSLAVAGPQGLLLNELGKAYFALGRFEPAKGCFAQAVLLAPDLAEAHGNLGAVLAQLGERGEALASLRRAAALQPAYPNAHFNLGRTLQELGELEEAERSYRRALALDPSMIDAHYNLGHLLTTSSRLDEAEAHYRAALALGRSDADLHFWLGNVLNVQGKFDEAEAAFRAALERDPAHPEARWALAVLRLGRHDAEGRGDAATGELRALSEWIASNPVKDPTRMVGAVQPFYLAYNERNHRELLAEHGRLCAAVLGEWSQRQGLSLPARRSRNTVRVGIVSAHVHDHSTWHAIVKGLVRRFDRERVELSVFSLGHWRDEESEVAASHAAHFEHDPTGKRDLRGWAETILARAPDALVYPAIGQDPMEARLAALRLAPLQLASWSHPETSGLPTIDGYLSAEAFEPDDAREHYSERLVALPHLGCCYIPLAPQAEDAQLAALGIGGDAVLALCTGSPFKYAPRNDWIFPEIARRAGNLTLIFFEIDPRLLCERLKRRLVDAFSRAGLDFSRHVTFLPMLPRARFHGLMRRSHLWLDTLGYSGFNTAMQAVECGLPLVAREGRFMRGRFASGILRRLGMHDCVATSDERYVELAVALANDESRQREARARIEASRDLLFDDAAPVRALEDFLFDATRQRA